MMLKGSFDMPSPYLIPSPAVFSARGQTTAILPSCPPGGQDWHLVLLLDKHNPSVWTKTSVLLVWSPSHSVLMFSILGPHILLQETNRTVTSISWSPRKEPALGGLKFQVSHLEHSLRPWEGNALPLPVHNRTIVQKYNYQSKIQ